MNTKLTNNDYVLAFKGTDENLCSAWIKQKGLKRQYKIGHWISGTKNFPLFLPRLYCYDGGLICDLYTGCSPKRWLLCKVPKYCLQHTVSFVPECSLKELLGIHKTYTRIPTKELENFTETSDIATTSLFVLEEVDREEQRNNIMPLLEAQYGIKFITSIDIP